MKQPGFNGKQESCFFVAHMVYMKIHPQHVSHVSEGMGVNLSQLTR